MPITNPKDGTQQGMRQGYNARNTVEYMHQGIHEKCILFLRACVHACVRACVCVCVCVCVRACVSARSTNHKEDKELCSRCTIVQNALLGCHKNK